MDMRSLDEPVARILHGDSYRPGFISASVLTYEPQAIVIDFEDNATADDYVSQKQLSGSIEYRVDPPNGRRVIFRPPA